MSLQGNINGKEIAGYKAIDSQMKELVLRACSVIPSHVLQLVIPLKIYRNRRQSIYINKRSLCFYYVFMVAYCFTMKVGEMKRVAFLCMLTESKREMI